jgi:stage V sporulation protein D (sporulation-specific penicillin-binding protein)
MVRLKRIKSNNLIAISSFFIIISFFSLLIFQLYRLQIAKAGFNHNSLSKLTKIPPLRGNIYLRDKDGNLFLAATSYYLYDLYFYPPKAKNIEKEIKTIFERLNTNKSQIKRINHELINTNDKTLINNELNELNTNKFENNSLPFENNSYNNKFVTNSCNNIRDEFACLISLAKNSSKSILLIKNLTDEQKREIEKLRYDSVFFEEKIFRQYPLNDLLGTVIGFARFNEETGLLEGQYGLERYYDEILKGEVGYRNNFQIIKNPQKGADIVLNIDYYIQRKTSEILKSAIQEFYASGGLIIVAEAKTGNILAVAEQPNYDPNKFSKQKDYSIFISRLSKNYEPGSVMKPFTYAAAFEEKLIKPEDTYEDKGYVVLNGWKIFNFDKKGRGVVDFKTALEQSLNTGSVYVSQLLGKTRFLKYIEAFRLNSKAEVDFPILEEPNFKNLKDPGREVNFGTASFGQGVALSPLNLVQSFNAFSNQGQILKLNFVKEIIYPDNSKKEIKPQVITKVMKKETLETILPILEGVVENQAKKAKIKGFRIAGKTGSALIPAAKETPENPSGYTEEAITNFIGFLPVSNPKYIVLVRLDKPAQGLLAFGTAAPTFRKVAEFLINYYNIEPDKFEELTKEIINF